MKRQERVIKIIERKYFVYRDLSLAMKLDSYE